MLLTKKKRGLCINKHGVSFPLQNQLVEDEGSWTFPQIWLVGERKRHDGACVQARPLGRGVDVFGLGQAGQLVLVARQAAEEDGAADAEDGGTPAEAVRPGVVIVALEDQLVELDGVDDEGDDL